MSNLQQAVSRVNATLNRAARDGDVVVAASPEDLHAILAALPTPEEREAIRRLGMYAHGPHAADGVLAYNYTTRTGGATDGE